MTERQLASLLYRDHLRLKHKNRNRLEAELSRSKQKLKQLRDREPDLALCDEDNNTSDGMHKALLQHLGEVCHRVVEGLSMYTYDI